MHKKLAIIYFNLSILIINKLALNSFDPFFLEHLTYPLSRFPACAAATADRPQGGKALPISPSPEEICEGSLGGNCQ